MAADDNGQLCTGCQGVGQKLNQYMSVVDGKTFTDFRMEACGSCHGSGMLNGRSQ